MAFGDRHLGDGDHRRPWRSCLGELGAHVLLVQLLDCVPVQFEFLGDVPDRGAPTAPADIKGKSLGVERIVRQEFQTLALHLAAPAAMDAPHLKLKEYPQPPPATIAPTTPLPTLPPPPPLPSTPPP